MCFVRQGRKGFATQNYTQMDGNEERGILQLQAWVTPLQAILKKWNSSPGHTEHDRQQGKKEAITDAEDGRHKDNEPKATSFAKEDSSVIPIIFKTVPTIKIRIKNTICKTRFNQGV